MWSVHNVFCQCRGNRRNHWKACRRGVLSVPRLSIPQVIAEGLKEEEIAGLREMFEMMDVDKSGTITLQELQEGLKKFGAKLSEEEIQKIMEEVREGDGGDGREGV